MKTNKWKIILLTVAVALLAVMVVTAAVVVQRAYGNWIVNRNNVQERLYEAMDALFAAVMLLLLFVPLLGLAVYGLIRALRPSGQPSALGRFLKAHGLQCALILAALFFLCFFLNRAALGRIANTPEISEVPAALADHRLSGWLGIAAVLTAEGAVVAWIAWARGKLKK